MIADATRSYTPEAKMTEYLSLRSVSVKGEQIWVEMNMRGALNRYVKPMYLLARLALALENRPGFKAVIYPDATYETLVILLENAAIRSLIRRNDLVATKAAAVAIMRDANSVIDLVVRRK